MTMWQSGGMGGHGSQNNPWMKLMGIVHKERRHTDNVQSQSGSNERNLNQWVQLRLPQLLSIVPCIFAPLRIAFQTLLCNFNARSRKCNEYIGFVQILDLKLWIYVHMRAGLTLNGPLGNSQFGGPFFTSIHFFYSTEIQTYILHTTFLVTM